MGATVQGEFHTTSTNVKDEACITQHKHPRKGEADKPWLSLSDVSISKFDLMEKQSYCNVDHNGLFFSGDSWSFCPQWQEGAIYTALHAVYRMIYDGSDPFSYLPTNRTNKAQQTEPEDTEQEINKKRRRRD